MPRLRAGGTSVIVDVIALDDDTTEVGQVIARPVERHRQVQCVLTVPERVAEVGAAIGSVEVPSRAISGVLHFDTARSLTDPKPLD